MRAYAERLLLHFSTQIMRREETLKGGGYYAHHLCVCRVFFEETISMIMPPSPLFPFSSVLHTHTSYLIFSTYTHKYSTSSPVFTDVCVEYFVINQYGFLFCLAYSFSLQIFSFDYIRLSQSLLLHILKLQNVCISYTLRIILSQK